jgi:branched-chain amino acid transport system permease protein
VLGGWGTFWGPIFGTAFMIVLPELLREVDVFRNMSVGVILALLAVFASQGLMPLIGDGIKKLRQPSQGDKQA